MKCCKFMHCSIQSFDNWVLYLFVFFILEFLSLETSILASLAYCSGMSSIFIS